MTANRTTINRPPDPPGITYQQNGGTYIIRLHGRPIGTVYTNQKRHGLWTAWTPTGNHMTTGPSRRQAVQLLLTTMQGET